MDNDKTINYFIKKVVEHLKTIQEYIINVSYEEFKNNEMLQSAICFQFVQVYENAKKINFLEDKEFNATVILLRGFRNIIVHEYGEVDFTLVYKTSKEDVPKFLEIVSKHI